MIIVVTKAYNAEKTIRRAVDSILNQTYRHFKYMLLDNGSTDKTSEIIAEYAEKDNRIHPLRNEINLAVTKKKENTVFWGNEEIFDLIQKKYPESLYYCALDADDEYLPTFFEKAMALIEKYNLDIAACGTQSIQELTGEHGNRNYSVPCDLILLEHDDFIRHRAEYDEFMWTFWGKIYSLTIVQKSFIENPLKVGFYGVDTFYATKAFTYSNRVGILAEKLHKNYILQSSVSSAAEKSGSLSRDFLRTYVLFGAYSDFLLSKSGTFIPSSNWELFASYFFYTRWTVCSTWKMEIPVMKKLSTTIRLLGAYINAVGIKGLLAVCIKVITTPFRKLRRKWKVWTD